jgi:hypothetical protein
MTLAGVIEVSCRGVLRTYHDGVWAGVAFRPERHHQNRRDDGIPATTHNEKATMRTKKINIEIEAPVSLDALVALDVNALCPELAGADRALSDARDRLQQLRTEIAGLELLADEHAQRIAAGQGDVATEHDHYGAVVDLQPRRAMLAAHERAVTDATKARDAAQRRAGELLEVEARRRHQVLASAGAVLLKELQKLKAAEDALAGACAAIPRPPGAGLLHLGSLREQALETLA